MNFRLCLIAITLATVSAFVPAQTPAKPAPKPAAKPAPAPSAAAPKEGSFGNAKSNRPILTLDELRDCLARQEKTRAQAEAATKLRARLDRDRAEIDRSGAELKEQLATLDRTNAEAVAQYNERAAARDKAIDDYQAATPEYNAGAEAVRVDREAFASQCENRRFREDDETAIRNAK